MDLKIIKRDGKEVRYNKDKIFNAIKKAVEATSHRQIDIKNICQDVEKEILNYSKVSNKISVEKIQDIVETQLMKNGLCDIAKAYILYRQQRNEFRNLNSIFFQKILKRNKAIAVENANASVNEKSFSGREKEMSGDLQKYIALNLHGFSEETIKAHKEMLIYQHDLDKAMLGEHNCLFVDMEKLLKDGFYTRNGSVRGANSFKTACQLIAVIFQCQSQVQFGGVATTHLDYDLAPYVKKSFKKHFKKGMKYLYNITYENIKNIFIDNKELKKKYPKAYSYAIDMLNEEGKQACEGLYHNLNTLESRQGSQVPFSSINIGRDTSSEGQLVTKWIFEASINGIGKFKTTSIFPISIFSYKQGVNANKEDSNYKLKQLALKSMSKRIYPNWCNGDWSQANEDETNKDTIFATMGCRTMIGNDVHGMGYNRVGRGNIVPNTIILPKLGIEYGICLGKRNKPDLQGFWNEFEKTLQLTEKTLLERYNIIIKQSPNAAPFMYQNGSIADANNCKKTVYNSIKHGTLAIGYIGIAEMCQALFGKNHAEDSNVHKFAIEVVKRINEYAKEATKRNLINFSCYATPAENLCNTALQGLKNQYGIIKNVTDRDFLTNSHHVPVWEKISIYEKLQIESPFCKYPTGGCITYIEVSSTFINNIKAIENIIDYAFKTLDIPYLAINFPIDTCLNCGYQNEFNNTCPKCNSKNIQQLRRVTGYLTSDRKNFNKGKVAEEKARIKHSAYTKF